MKATFETHGDGDRTTYVVVREDDGKFVIRYGSTSGEDRAIAYALSGTRLNLKDANRELIHAQHMVTQAIETLNALVVLQIRHTESK